MGCSKPELSTRVCFVKQNSRVPTEPIYFCEPKPEPESGTQNKT